MTYKYDVIPLTEGLDFNTATSLAKPGSLRDCMNYEFVDGAGLRRIDGFRPYDGSNISQTDKVFILRCTTLLGLGPDFNVPVWLYVANAESNPNNVPFGQMFWKTLILPSSGGVSLIPFLRINCPSYADPSFVPGDITILNDATVLEAGYVPGAGSIMTPDDLTDAEYLAIFNSATRDARTEKYLFHKSNNGQTVGGASYSNNTINTDNTIGTPAVSGFSSIVDVWCDEKAGVTYTVGDAVLFTGTQAKQVYPGDYIYTTDNAGLIDDPWLVLKAETGLAANKRFEAVPLAVQSGFGADSYYKQPFTVHNIYSTPSVFRLYRDAGADAITSVVLAEKLHDRQVESRAEVAVMWTRFSEEAALTSNSVTAVAASTSFGGSGNRLSWNSGAPDECVYTDTNGSAEYMPLISAGAVKAVVCTKPGTGYSGTTTATYAGGTSGSSGGNGLVYTNNISKVYPTFLHTGWVVPFDAGSKSSGYLNKVNRYKDTAGSTYQTATLTGKTCTTFLHSITDSLVPYSGASNQARIFNDQWKTTSGSATDSDSIVSAILTDNGTTITNSYNWGRFPTSSVAFTGTNGFVGFGGLGGVIPEDSLIKGIALKVSIQVTASTDSSSIYTTGGATARASLFKNYGATALGAPLELLSASGSFGATWNADTMAETTFTAGGSANSWGNTPLKLEDLLDPTFGVSFDIKLERSDSTATPTGTIVIDVVSLEVTYELPSVRLYFTNTAGGAGAYTVMHGDVVDYVVSKGALETGDAEGFMTITNLRTVTAGLHAAVTSPCFTIGNDFYVYENPALTSLVARTSGEMVFNGFDSYRTIKAEGSLYTSVRGNFYFNADYDSFLICSGAGRMRQFDGKYMTKAYAINPRQENSAALDKPRHAAIKDFRAWLGYNSGEVTFSAPGDPMNYSGFEGAGSLGAGDNVVGLQNMPGNSLCVACLNSMKAVVGSSEEDYAIQTLVADEGAFEYSVVPAGGRILYTSPSGITTLDQSEKYGNFVPRPLSFDVNPWLLPRMNSGLATYYSPSESDLPLDGGLLFVRAHAIPQRNQYRLYFKDGVQLWMTMLGDQAEFTIARYDFPRNKSNSMEASPYNFGGMPYPLFVTTPMEKRAHTPYKTLCLFDPELAIRFGNATYGVAGGMYILDCGDYFCSQGPEFIRHPIPHFFTVNFSYLQNPFQDKTIRKVRLEGQSKGYAPMVVYTKDGYVDDSDILFDEVLTPISLPETTRKTSLLSYKPEATMASVAATGRVISIMVVGSDAAFPPTTAFELANTLPTYGTTSHYAQALFVQYEEGKEDA